MINAKGALERGVRRWHQVISTISLASLVAAWGLPFIPSKNSFEKGSVEIYSYSDQFAGRGRVISPVEILPRMYLEGFEPFEKYNVAISYMKNPPKKRSGKLINESNLTETIKNVFYNQSYFKRLRSEWGQKEALYINDNHVEDFITMILMANEPYYSRTDGRIPLDLSQLTRVIALYEMFALNPTERVSTDAKDRFGLDQTKREVFKENMRIFASNGKQSFPAFQQLLRTIYKTGHISMMAEVPRTRIEDPRWTQWMLSREANRDLFWHLFTSLCNTREDVGTGRPLIFVQEDFILGKKGLKLTLTQKGNPTHMAIGLTHYLRANNALEVQNLKIVIDRDLRVPEMQFSSLLDTFPLAQTIVLESLGNECDITKNLSLMNVVLDHEKKRKERGMEQMLTGFVLGDYKSFNDFSKHQLFNLDLKTVGFLTLIKRVTCCVGTEDPRLYGAEPSTPNFFGQFGIPENRKSNIRHIVAPYTVFFDVNTIEALPMLEEIDISITKTDLGKNYRDSDLQTPLLKMMPVRTVRLHGYSNKAGKSYQHMFQKVLKIEALKNLDIADVPIMAGNVLSILEENHEVTRENIKVFSFSYLEGSKNVAYGSRISAGTPGLLEQVMNALPNLEVLNIHVDQSSPGVYNLLRDIKYLLRCNTRYTPEEIKKIINVQMRLPLNVTSNLDCHTIIEAIIDDLKPVIDNIFHQVIECPNGVDGTKLKRMTKTEYKVELADIFRKITCRVKPQREVE
ncbi:hypothetical protein NEDG_01503 [Nematocida displodere]|uniref:Uncharacterized protein n=1 Tax=Nematocida displodere TaxID=1805483 RepID=A0A177EE15_9MICR|nr:hypothetical protein NEDG_01503 [Nematocida displodere]